MPPRGKKKKKKKDKTATTTNHKKYQLFLPNNTDHWGFTVRKIFPFCLILHCSKQQQAAKVNGKQCDQYRARKSASMPEKSNTRAIIILNEYPEQYQSKN